MLATLILFLRKSSFYCIVCSQGKQLVFFVSSAAPKPVPSGISFQRRSEQLLRGTNPGETGVYGRRSDQRRGPAAAGGLPVKLGKLIFICDLT